MTLDLAIVPCVISRAVGCRNTGVACGVKRKETRIKLMRTFLSERPVKLFTFNRDLFSSPSLKDLLIKFNTSRLSSAAMERISSLSKDVLKP